MIFKYLTRSGKAVSINESSTLNMNDIVNCMIKESYSKGDGALVIFIGFIKGIVDGVEVYSLNYEAYEPYTSKKLRKLKIFIETLKKLSMLRLFIE